MADVYDYNSILSQQPSGGMADVARNAIFGQQQQQQNENVLAKQQFEQQQAQKAATIAEQRRQQQYGLYKSMVADPSAHNVFGYMAAFPEISEGVKRAYDVLQPAQQQAELRTATDVAMALNNGKTDVARTILSTRKDSDKAAGIDTTHYDQILKLIDEDPAHSKALANMFMATVLGKDKFAEAFPALSKLPSDVAKGEAEATIKGAEAAAKPTMIESDLATAAATRKRMAAQTANEIADIAVKREGLVLERDKLESGIELKLQEMAVNGIKPDPASIGIMNTAAGEAVSANMLSDKEKDLAGRIRTSGMGSGAHVTAWEAIKRATGSQDGYTQLRAEWAQLKNKAALANRKDMPGAMSDADREFLLKGFPPENASPEYLAHFLEVMAMGHRAVSLSEDRKASWVGANGNLSPAKSDVSINGTMVPRGTTFAEFMRSAAKSDTRGQLPSDIGELAKKYGGKK